MIGRLLGWMTGGLTPALMVVTAAAVGLAGLQTVRLYKETTEFSQFREATIEANLAREKTYALNILKAQQTEHALNDQADIIRKDSHDAIKNLDGRVADLLGQLRRTRADRPVAQSGQPAEASGSVASCTGAGLYRPDGEFLVGIAASAAQVGIERDECRALYNAARIALTD